MGDDRDRGWTPPRGVLLSMRALRDHGGDDLSLHRLAVVGVGHAQGGQGVELTPLAGHGPLGLIRDFEVSPSGELYVEPPSNQRFQRQIDIYHWDGRYAGQVIVSSPEPIQENQFLGVNRWGWVYVGVNLNQPHQARVLVVSPHGEVLHDLAVHPIPVYSAVYGRVTANGILYLVQSTGHRYRGR